MTTGRPVAKTLIKYNSNSSEENEEEKYLAYWTKISSWNDENVIDFRWSGVQEEDGEDIALANFIENYKSKLIKIFLKKVTGWLFDDCGLVPSEKKN